MADESPEVPEDLAQVAKEKGIPLDLMRRALALGFPAEAIKQQIQLPEATPEQAEQFIAEQERIRAGGEIAIPEELAKAAAKNGWPEELIKRALALGAQAEMLIRQMEAGIRPEQAERFIAQQERMRAAAARGEQVLDLSWMRVPTEWGIRARPGKKGLTVSALNIGSYGDIPHRWPYQSEMPRGPHPIPALAPVGHPLHEQAAPRAPPALACARPWGAATGRRRGAPHPSTRTPARAPRRTYAAGGRRDSPSAPIRRHRRGWGCPGRRCGELPTCPRGSRFAVAWSVSKRRPE